MSKAIIIIQLQLVILLFFGIEENKEMHPLVLKVEVNNLRNSNGVVQFALYNKEGSIPDENFKKCYKILKAKIINNSSTVTFADIPVGKYAVNIFHDENNNGKIDKGFILPIEGVGFSKFESIGLTNRPSFSKASFNIVSNKTMNIKIIYF